MPWIELIRLLLPIIIELIGNKKKNGKSLEDIQACWADPRSRAQFVEELAFHTAVTNRIDVVIAGLEVFDHPLIPVLIRAIYEVA